MKVHLLDPTHSPRAQDVFGHQLPTLQWPTRKYEVIVPGGTVDSSLGMPSLRWAGQKPDTIRAQA